MEKAIEKIRSEMEKNTSNTYIQVVGGFLLQHLDMNPQDAEEILAADKTIGKSIDAMRKEAEKKKSGGCAVLTDQEGFVVILKYFGLDPLSPAQCSPPSSLVAPPEAPAPVSKPKSDTNFNITLEDLL